MLKLCLKDCLASRWLWLLALLAFVLYAASPLGWISLAYMLLGGLLVLGCLLITAAIEDKFKTETLVASLPVRRATIVAGRYLLAGLLTLVCGAAVFGALVPLSRLVGRESRMLMNPRLMLSVDGAAGYLLFVVLLVAFFLPFYFGLGLGKGSAFFAGALMALSAVLYGVERLWVGRSGGRPGPEIFNLGPGQDIGGAFIRLIGAFRAGLSNGLFALAVLTILAAASVLSFSLSAYLYEKREL
jgi:hypothetical protein